MAVRANVARSLECLHWERRHEGQHKKENVYSRVMGCTVVLDKGADNFGNEIGLMAVHRHNVLANAAWPRRLIGVWDWCWASASARASTS